MLADKIVEIGKCLDHDTIANHLLGCFVSFLQDPESEVRTIAATRSAEFCKFIDGSSIIKKILPALKKLSTDTFVHVRSILLVFLYYRGFI